MLDPYIRSYMRYTCVHTYVYPYIRWQKSCTTYTYQNHSPNVRHQ